MSFINKAGQFAGKAAAYAWDGTALASTQFAQGAKQGYVEKSAELRARREAVQAGLAFTPVAVRPRKIATAKA